MFNRFEREAMQSLLKEVQRKLVLAQTGFAGRKGTNKATTRRRTTQMLTLQRLLEVK